MKILLERGWHDSAAKRPDIAKMGLCLSEMRRALSGVGSGEHSPELVWSESSDLDLEVGAMSPVASDFEEDTSEKSPHKPLIEFL